MENAYGEDNESLSSSFWTNKDYQEECYVKVGRNQMQLVICKQEVNEEEGCCVKDDRVTEKIGKKLQETKDEQDYVEQQSKNQDEWVSQHDRSSVKPSGEEKDDCKKKRESQSGSKHKESKDYSEKEGAEEEMSDCEHLIIENLHTGIEEAQR